MLFWHGLIPKMPFAITTLDKVLMKPFAQIVLISWVFIFALVSSSDVHSICLSTGIGDFFCRWVHYPKVYANLFRNHFQKVCSGRAHAAMLIYFNRNTQSCSITSGLHDHVITKTLGNVIQWRLFSKLSHISWVVVKAWLPFFHENKCLPHSGLPRPNSQVAWTIGSPPSFAFARPINLLTLAFVQDPCLASCIILNTSLVLLHYFRH
mmetsp:Transcript_7662/g.20403  ORF Transcript_7662/g.20403 Transcript_7662/m.20403 type:complete len:208 (+) Transcript_7662:1009-1632(+)